MATEGGNQSQLRRRGRRDTEEPERTELSERELAVAVAVAHENEEENEERWVGPLPVEATLAKKRKGNYGDRRGASWSAASLPGESSSQTPERMVCDCGAVYPQNRGSPRFWLPCTCVSSANSDWSEYSVFYNI